MKKEINSKSRRKWIRGGLAAFASVALLTTGFAIYVVGVTKDKVNGGIGVTVDTAENRNITFEAKLKDNIIKLAEPDNVTGKFVKAEGITADNKQDFTISFEKFEITMGDSVVKDYDCVTLSLLAKPDKDNGGAIAGDIVDNIAVAGKLESSIAKNRPATDATYFEITKTTIALPTEVSETANADGIKLTKDGTTNTFTMESMKSFEIFGWGTFFNKQSPCTYYNTVLTSDLQTVKNADKVQGELDDMAKKYENKQICLHMELTKKTTVTA